jgi:catechol 2,3-dioxygenase-like lactoylglutathione lyase family enzyme
MKPITVRGVRSVDIEMSQPERAAEFYAKIWNLTEVERAGDSVWFRGTGPYHHILAVHGSSGGAALRRMTFDAADRSSVDALHKKITDSGCVADAPHQINGPGGGYGFGFADVENRNLAIVCDVRDHKDTADVRDRPRKIAHVNINAAQLEKTNRFLTETLGLRFVDQSGPLHFFHCDNSDHSSIVTGATKTPTLNHVSFEMPDLESCMRGGGRMRDAGYPIEWGPGRHGAGNNVFCYFAGPEEYPIEYTAEVLQIDDSYEFHGPDHWKWPPGRLDQWGITPPHTARWKRIQDLVLFSSGQYRL